MPPPTKTVGDLVARVHFQIAGTAAVDPLLSVEIKNALAYTLYDLINKIDHPAFRSAATLTTVAGTQAYAMPSDFVRLIDPGIRDTASPFGTLRLFDQQGFDNSGAAGFYQSNGRPMFYTLRGRLWGESQTTWSGDQVIQFVPTPAAAHTYTFNYFAMPDDLSEVPDKTDIDNRYPRYAMQGLFHGALTHFSQYLSVSQIQFHESKYLEAMRDLARNAKLVVGRGYKKRPYRTEHFYPDMPVGTLTGADPAG